MENGELSAKPTPASVFDVPIIPSLDKLNEVYERMFSDIGLKSVELERVNDPVRGTFRIVARRDIAVGECFMVERATALSAHLRVITVTRDAGLPTIADQILYGSVESDRIIEQLPVPDTIDAEILSKPISIMGTLIHMSAQRINKNVASALATRKQILALVRQYPSCYMIFRPIGDVYLRSLRAAHPTWGDTELRAQLDTLARGRDDKTAKLTLLEYSDLLMERNSIPVSTAPTGITNGSAYFDVLTRINHSCEPNCTLSSHGRFGMAVATRPIRRGDEVTWNYASETLTAPYEFRRTILKETVGFYCNCSRCLRDIAAGGTLDRLVPNNYALYTLLTKELNDASKWRNIIFTQLPEYNKAASNTMLTEDRSALFRLTTMYLKQHSRALMSIPNEVRLPLAVRAYVVSAAVSLLMVPNIAVIDKLNDWIACFVETLPLLLRVLDDMIDANTSPSDQFVADVFATCRWREALFIYASWVLSVQQAGKMTTAITERFNLAVTVQQLLKPFEQRIRRFGPAPTLDNPTVSWFFANQLFVAYEMSSMIALYRGLVQLTANF